MGIQGLDLEVSKNDLTILYSFFSGHITLWGHKQAVKEHGDTQLLLLNAKGFCKKGWL